MRRASFFLLFCQSQSFANLPDTFAIQRFPRAVSIFPALDINQQGLDRLSAIGRPDRLAGRLTMQGRQFFIHPARPVRFHHLCNLGHNLLIFYQCIRLGQRGDILISVSGTRQHGIHILDLIQS
jgi:hypothetical protein